MTYRPIGNYGIIGDTRSAALISIDGSIDWFCCPSFDSPSVFAALLGDQRGGHFSIAPDCPAADLTHKQFYWPDTNVLVTRFLAEDGVGEITDFMPVATGDGDPTHRQLIRRVRVVRGALTFRLRCEPAFDYARENPSNVDRRAWRDLRRARLAPRSRLADPARGRRYGRSRQHSPWKRTRGWTFVLRQLADEEDDLRPRARRARGGTGLPGDDRLLA